jgi:iron(III) transport system substrate-binding protein
MDRKHWSIALSAAFMALLLDWAVSAPGGTAEKTPTMESIIQGAKKEGKVSWGTNLDESEVKELNKAFQKEYPFIKRVDYSRLRGAEEHERTISEMQAGIFTYDVVSVQEELISRYEKVGFLIPPVDWSGLFGVDPRMLHPQRFGVVTGSNPAGITYNKSKVPKEQIPKRWSDCYNPFFKGRLAVDVRPIHMLSIMAGYGEEWTLDFAKKLAANKPRWMRGQTAADTLLAAGELLISCPASHGSWYRQVSQNPNFPVGFVFPEGPIVSQQGLLLAPMKGSGSPNAALLLTGWTGSKGVTYLDTGRESIFHPGTKLGAEFKRMGREVKVQSWELIADTDRKINKILEVWGFPKPSK